MDFITIQIQQDDFSFIPLEIPLGVELSLMEVLRGENHPIDAICGGMAICGTCRVEVLNKDEVDLEGINDAEMCMLDSPPCNTGNCRLSCQIKISEKVDGLKILIPTDF